MYKTKKILSIIPARGGSKGLPGKNIKEFCGKPLIAWAIEKAKKCKYIDRLIVSTDCEQIADVSRNYGAEVPFLRGKNLAEDTTPMVPVIVDAIKRIDENFDYAVMLQANSPLTLQSTLNEVIEKLISQDADVAFTVCKADHPPQWTLKLNDNDVSFAFLKKDEKISTFGRQDEAVLYRATAAIFAVKIPYLLEKQGSVRLALPASGQKSTAVITDNYSAVDIDTELDFYMAETVFNKIFKGEMQC